MRWGAVPHTVLAVRSGGASGSPPPRPRESRPEEDEGCDRRSEDGKTDGPLAIDLRLEGGRRRDVWPQVQGTVPHEQAQDGEVDEEDQRWEPADPLRPWKVLHSYCSRIRRIEPFSTPHDQAGIICVWHPVTLRTSSWCTQRKTVD